MPLFPRCEACLVYWERLFAKDESDLHGSVQNLSIPLSRKEELLEVVPWPDDISREVDVGRSHDIEPLEREGIVGTMNHIDGDYQLKCTDETEKVLKYMLCFSDEEAEADFLPCSETFHPDMSVQLCRCNEGANGKRVDGSVL